MEDHAGYDDGEQTIVYRKQSARIVALLLFCSCAHQSAASSDEVYRSIQRLEADLARSEAQLARSTDCSASRAHIDALCASSRALCTLTTTIAESDAAARCTRARDMCTSARGTEPTCLRDPPS